MTQNKDSQVNLISELIFYKEQVYKLQQKLFQCEKKLETYVKQNQKIKQLQKSNSDNSSRLFQCVSNVRDLLHSNKNIRQELEKQKQLREIAELKIQKLQNQIKKQKQEKNFLLSRRNKDDQNKQLNELKSNKQLNINKLSKLQKLSKLKLSSKKYSMNDFQQNFNDISPSKSTAEKLKQLGHDYGVATFRIKQEIKKSPKKNHKLSKSVDLKKQEKRYFDAQLRRKKSLQQSQNRMEQLQYKPIKPNSINL